MSTLINQHLRPRSIGSSEALLSLPVSLSPGSVLVPAPSRSSSLIDALKSSSAASSQPNLNPNIRKIIITLILPTRGLIVHSTTAFFLRHLTPSPSFYSSSLPCVLFFHFFSDHFFIHNLHILPHYYPITGLLSLGLISSDPQPASPFSCPGLRNPTKGEKKINPSTSESGIGSLESANNRASLLRSFFNTFFLLRLTSDILTFSRMLDPRSRVSSHLHLPYCLRRLSSSAGAVT